MKLQLILIALCCITGQLLNAQSLKGQIIEAETKQGIPFVTVQLGDNYGVISNEEGYFIIQRKSVKDDTSLIFSSMGFETLEVPVSDFKNDQVITLKPATTELDEVLLFDKQLSAEEILEKFKSNAKDNHPFSNTRVQIFVRSNDDYKAEKFGVDVKKASFLSRSERKRMNDNMENLERKITSVSSKSYRERLINIYAFEDTLVNEYKKALNLINRETTFNTEDIQEEVFFELMKSLESPYSFKVKTGIIPIDKDVSLNELIEDIEKDKLKLPDTIYQKNTWRSKTYKSKTTSFKDDFFTNPNRYDYELVGVTKAYGEPCYHIRFSPDSWSWKGKYIGNLYINTRDFGMVSYNYDLKEGKKAMNVNLKFVLGVKVNTFKDSGLLIFSRTKENTYYPKYIKQTDGNYAYISRSLSFKENNPNRSERKQLKLKFELEYNLMETTEYVGIEIETISPELVNTLAFKDHILIDEVNSYDTNYWKDYNIIEATEAIKTYK